MTKEEKELLYTLRWHLREQWGEENARRKAFEILGNLLDPEAQPESRPSVSGVNQHHLWCPFALSDFPKAPTQGSYENGYPKGAIVHFTAGRHNDLKDSISYQIKSGCTYFLIDKDGKIAQNFPLDSWGYHAGEVVTKMVDGKPVREVKSRWPGLGEGVSKKVVGIEVQCAGRVTPKDGKYETDFDTLLDPEHVRHIPHSVNDQQEAGYYHKYTEAQEKSLRHLILWLYHNNTEIFSLDYVLGHDEVSGPQGIGKWRKNDPGGSLSQTMDSFRAELKAAAKL